MPFLSKGDSTLQVKSEVLVFGENNGNIIFQIPNNYIFQGLVIRG